MEDTNKRISASRIKTLKGCSWQYWANYILKLPQINNEGALRGSGCHLIFELLLNKRHRKHYDKIVEEDSISGSPAVNRLVKKYMTRVGLETEINYKMIDEMILVGLNHDFFCKGAKLFDSEYEFNLVNEKPKYLTRGFIDKWAVDKKKKLVKIIDYKSSKEKYEGEEHVSNVQAMIYSLVAKKVHPNYKCIVEFIFLRFPKDPTLVVEFDDLVLEGFEHYLAEIQTKIDNFSYSDAVSDFAADKPPGDGFSGRLLCGRATHPGQLKKDGKPMWHCSYKFPFDYYCLLDDKNNVLKTSFKSSDLEKSQKEGQSIEKRAYFGCPRFNKISVESF